jgi:formylglycine-generating enzyme required for sulfatase activity
MNHKFVGLGLLMTALLFWGCENPTTQQEDVSITLLSIPGITAPVANATPDTDTIDTAQYTATIIWNPNHTTFQSDTVYTASLTLTPKKGYTLTGVAANSFIVDGASSVNHGAGFGSVTVTFPSTSANTITQLAIPGVTAPTVGATPVTATINTDQYSATISWSPNHTVFANSTIYTATLNISPKGDYSLSGLAANSFTVAGASVSHGANSGTVVASFPSTPATTISLLAIPGIAAPATGATPTTNTIDTAQYTATISWNPNHAVFVNSTVYTANLNLTAKTGYTLNGVAANSFTIAGATVSHAAGSGSISAAFPATAEDYTSANIGTLKYIPTGRFQRDFTSSNISIISQSFNISQYEISRQQFLAIMQQDPSDTNVSSGNTDPVQNVNWYQAIAFCNKLSLAESLEPVYSVSVAGTPVNWQALTFSAIPTSENADWNAASADWSKNGYRLPTEMEWMWAAMGAPADGQGNTPNTTGYGKIFAGSNGSNSIGDYAWYTVNSSNSTHPRGSKLANERGLYDMSGNVAEWCWDSNADYPAGTLTDYRGGAGTSNGRIARGGNWAENSNKCSLYNRGESLANQQHAIIGFRVVRR